MNKAVILTILIWLALLAVLALLAGCAGTPTIGSVAGGECKLPGLHTPTYAVRGWQKYDQEWIDDATEALVRGCNQPRPKARPASLDAPKVITPSSVITPKKKHWWQR